MLKKKVMMSLTIILCMLLQTAGFTAAGVGNVKSGASNGASSGASSGGDVRGHWAEAQITAWLEKGLVKGYEDGSFRPESPITRAEFAALVNRAFGFVKKASGSFSDVKTGKWYYDDIAIAKAEGYLNGNGRNMALPEQPVSRQEMAVILSRVLKLKADDASARRFADSKAIPAWSAGAVGAVSGLGYINKYEDDTFKPQKDATRAEAVFMLANAAGTVYNTAGMYGPVNGSSTIEGNVTVSNRDIVLNNLIIKGSLYLTEGIGDGNATLDRVSVTGTTLVSGGGEHSVVMTDCTLGKLVISVPDRTKVRIAARWSTVVGPVEVRSPMKLEEADINGSGYGDISLDLPEGASAELSGSFDKVELLSDGLHLSLLSGSVKELTNNGRGAIITASDQVSIGTLTVYQPMELTGNCTVNIADINANNVKLEPKPYTVRLAPDLFGVSVTAALPVVVSASGGGGSTGTPVIPVVPPAETTITGTQPLADIQVAYGTTLGAVSLPSAVTLNLSSGSSASASVVWGGSTPAYDPTVAGSYTFTGSVSVASGITNPNHVTASVKVVVLEKALPAVTTIGAFEVVSVPIGTTLSAITFPGTALLHLDDKTTTNAAVSWSADAVPVYDPTKAGGYEFTGMITLPTAVSNPNALHASITVNVQSISVSSIDPIADRHVLAGTTSDTLNLPASVRIRLSDGTSAVAAVNWDMGGYSSNVLGLHVLSGTITLPAGTANPGDIRASARVYVVQPYSDPAPDSKLISSTGIVIDDCENTSGWQAEAAVLSADTSNKISGSSALNITSDVALGGDDFYAQKTYTNMDFTGVENVQLCLYTPDSSRLDGISVRLFSSNGGNYSKYTKDDELVNGWNRITISKQSFLQHDAADWSSIITIRITVVANTTIAGCKPSVNLDRIACNVGSRAKLLFTFDDAWYNIMDPSVTGGAFAYLTSKGMKATTWANKINSAGVTGTAHVGERCNEDDLAVLYQAGWDIGNHTADHDGSIDVMTDAQLSSEYLSNQQWLESKGWTRGMNFVAYPDGAYDERLIGILKGIGVLAARTTVYGLQSLPTDNIFKLKCVYLDHTQTNEELKSKIDEAMRTGSTLIFMIHKVETEPVDHLTTTTEQIHNIIDYVDAHKDAIDVVTISEWYNGYIMK